MSLCKEEYLKQFDRNRAIYKDRLSNDYYVDCQDVAYDLWRLLISDETTVNTDNPHQKNYNLTYILENMRKDHIKEVASKILERVPIKDVMAMLEKYAVVVTGVKEGRDINTEKTYKEVIKDIKPGEVWVGIHYKMYINKDNGALIIRKKDDTIINEYSVSLRGIFRLERVEYSFESAFKALEDGIEIQSTVGEKYRYKKIDGQYHFYCEGINDWASYDGSFVPEEIKGKWYIND